MKINDRRLIEDYLPLDEINSIAAKEKLTGSQHYVSLVHYWPARRPITASRAAIYAALVPAPSTDHERREAASFVTKLAAFKPDPEVVKEASNRIRKAHGGKAPKILDMFAGGGAIPLEAARLGCESHAVDYNPVAHLIELCTLVFPQKYGSSLADDFQQWSQVVLDRMRQELSDIYPTVPISGAGEIALQKTLFRSRDPQLVLGVEPVAYIWARTVPCRRPGCDAPVPLVRQSWLRKKDGAVAAVPRIENGCDLRWKIVSGRSAKDIAADESQTRAGQAVCVACSTPVSSDYVKEMSKAGHLSEELAAVVVDGGRSKLYVSPHTAMLPDNDECLYRLAKLLEETGLAPLDEQMNTADSTTVAGRGYGISQWRELFTPRQLLVLFTLVKEIRLAYVEMLDKGMAEDRARALRTYFAMAFGRLLITFNKFTRWRSNRQVTEGVFDRQALKMTYDFSEINCLTNTQGCLPFALEREAYCIRELAKVDHTAVVTRGNATNLFYDDETFDAVVTDPPYYSSIYYADLSAFFYVWLKRIVGDLYPEHFTLSAPPKRREAVAQPSEHGGNAQIAKEHYQNLMSRSFVEARRVLKPGGPLVCVYAHRTTEGWATLIRALINAGLTVTEAWPVQTESRSRMNTLGAAALSDSIFFVARRRQESKIGEYETDVAPELRRIARERVVTLWADGKGIGGADLLMAAVGAGLGAYTKFVNVEYANGEPMPAERYLREVEGVVLNVMLDEIFGLRDTSVGSVDPLTRFYVLWRFTYRESSINAGEAYVFCYPQGIEIDGPSGLSGSPPSLVEKTGSSKFRVRNYEERGSEEKLGVGTDDQPAPLIDVLHRVLWLMDNRPTEQLLIFLNEVRPNVEQLRLVTQALCAPVLRHHEAQDATPTKELSILSKLAANWQSLIEGVTFSQEIKGMVKKGTKKSKLPLYPEENNL